MLGKGETSMVGWENEKDVSYFRLRHILMMGYLNVVIPG